MLFRPNWSIHCENTTSYPCLKMAATTAKYYLRFRICWCHCLQKVKVYQETKFRRDTPIYGWDITTSGFEKQTSAILEFYFRFWSSLFRRNRRVILHPAAEFRPNRNIRRGNSLWRHIDFQGGGRQPCCICFRVMVDHPQSAFRGLNSILKSLLCRINSSGDIAM